MTYFARTLPTQLKTAPHEALRAGFGALFGILIAGGVGGWYNGMLGTAVLLVAPMGASAVLLFAVPASPLAQPYALLGGNLIAALAGVTAAHVIPWPLLAAAVAVGGAIAVMLLCRCLHPPSGAVALLPVLGALHGPLVGYGFVTVPVLLDSVLLLAAALAYNAITGRSYPHRPHAVAHPSPQVAPRRLTPADFKTVLADYGEALVIGADDLEKLYEELAARAGQAL